MRKTISCKVIKSVPLSKSDDGLRSAGNSNARHAGVSNVAALTYTNRLIIIRTDPDDCLTARSLDFCV
jgi:hypothetical protein